MNEWDRLTEFYTGFRTEDHNRSLRATGVHIASPSASSDYAPPEPSPLPSPLHRALLQRVRVCALINSGLANHPNRLDADSWHELRDALGLFDPAGDGARATVRRAL